jgi:hypothetical protein
MVKFDGFASRLSEFYYCFPQLDGTLNANIIDAAAPTRQNFYKLYKKLTLIVADIVDAAYLPYKCFISYIVCYDCKIFLFIELMLLQVL